jgi:hypothetical protein
MHILAGCQITWVNIKNIRVISGMINGDMTITVMVTSYRLQVTGFRLQDKLVYGE